MVSKTTKKGLVTAGVGIGSFLSGLAVGHFAIPVAAEALAPSWAKNVVDNMIVSHPLGVTPHTMGFKYMGKMLNWRGLTTVFYTVWSYTQEGQDLDGWIEIVHDETMDTTTVYYRLERNMSIEYSGVGIQTTTVSVPYGKFEA